MCRNRFSVFTQLLKPLLKLWGEIAHKHAPLIQCAWLIASRQWDTESKSKMSSSLYTTDTFTFWHSSRLGSLAEFLWAWITIPLYRLFQINKSWFTNTSVKLCHIGRLFFVSWVYPELPKTLGRGLRISVTGWIFPTHSYSPCEHVAVWFQRRERLCNSSCANY